eukprot:1464279-Amphidinium_carterae.1
MVSSFFSHFYFLGVFLGWNVHNTIDIRIVCARRVDGNSHWSQAPNCINSVHIRNKASGEWSIIPARIMRTQLLEHRPQAVVETEL